MIKEAYCSYEVSKLLKEKGFNWHTQYVYTLDGTGSTPHKIGNWRAKSNIQKPTQQMAMKWFREVHGIFIAINNDDLDFNWQCYDLINRDSTLDPKILSESYAGYKIYEEAVDAALKYCLENLI